MNETIEQIIHNIEAEEQHVRLSSTEAGVFTLKTKAVGRLTYVNPNGDISRLTRGDELILTMEAKLVINVQALTLTEVKRLLEERGLKP